MEEWRGRRTTRVSEDRPHLRSPSMGEVDNMAEQDLASIRQRFDDSLRTLITPSESLKHTNSGTGQQSQLRK